MNYHGKLYGKIFNKHFDTGKTTDDFDGLVKELEERVTDLKIIRDQIAYENIFGTSDKWEGMEELVNKWIERKEILIKESK